MQVAHEAGVALVEMHVGSDGGTPSSDPERLRAFQDGTRRHCPDIIVQFSMRGRGRALEARGTLLRLRPDLVSPATGSVKFPTIAQEKPPDIVRTLAARMRDRGVRPEIEVFGLAML